MKQFDISNSRVMELLSSTLVHGNYDTTSNAAKARMK